jgi:HPt (histidine-containing phosphotransfer) domain-containing protein
MLNKYSPNKPAPGTPPIPPKARKIQADLTYLRGVANGNPDFVREMVGTLLESVPKSLDLIKLNVQNSDWQSLSKGIHKIKPALTMMGLKGLREEAVELEEMIKHDQTGTSMNKVLLFIEEIGHAVDSMKSLTV